MKIISWQNLLTDHQYFTWFEMQARGHEISFILGKTQDQDRQNQGWTSSKSGQIPAYKLSIKGWWKQGRELILQNRESIHVFNGFWADRRFFLLILYAVAHNIKTVVLNESYSEINTGYLREENKFISLIKKLMRPLSYRIAILLLKLTNPKNPICLLAISPLAKKQFLQAGVNESQIYPWGYFIPESKQVEKPIKQTVPPLKLVFVGTLLRRKGLDLVIKAVREINKENSLVTLEIYGSGDIHQWMNDDEKNILYKGVIPFGHAQEVISKYDFLILPSLHDGWGVVVNEALLQGVPVILSDSVGAQSIINTSKAGILFKSNDLNDLVAAIRELIAKPEMREKMAINAEVVANKITPSSATKYLEQVLVHFFDHQEPHPTPNWE